MKDWKSHFHICTRAGTPYIETAILTIQGFQFDFIPFVVCSKMGLKSTITWIKSILNLLSRLIFLSCIFITTWQTLNCIMKYRENPQSTSSAMEFIGNLPLSAITICSKLYGGRKNYLDGVPMNKTWSLWSKVC